jgi:serine/threonine protein kinase
MPPTPRNAVALLFGIGEYRQRERIAPLRYPGRDARALARLLADGDCCGFPRERVALLTDQHAGRRHMVRRLSRWLPQQAHGAELVLIYFAGHGVVQSVGGRDEGFLLPHDADPDDVIATGIAMSDVARWIEGIDAGAIVVCLDCCHAGSILPREGMSLRAADRDMYIQPSVIQRLGGRGRFLIASCDKGQKSIEAEELRHGLFTYHLLEGLRGAGDRDGDGLVGVAELFNYVAAAVSRDARERFGREQSPWTSAIYNEDAILATVHPGRPPDTEPRSTAGHNVQQTTAEDEEIIIRLRGLRHRPDSTALPLIFRSLSHRAEPVRQRARQALHALGWDQASRAAEDLARAADTENVGALLDGLAALEAHLRVVGLLDRLAGLLRGGLRDRAVWLLDRKRLALERDRLAEVFREKNSGYEILKVLGPGLYTGAYLARSEVTGLEVVVRVLRPEYAGQPLVRSHFLELGRKAVRLVHQNLALTRDVLAFSDRELYFTLRDFIPGATLREVLESGRRFEPAQVFRILRQVIEALTPLHREGLVHGGVKPSNLFLTRDDRVVLGDPSLPIPASGWDLPRLAYDFRYAPPELFRSGGGLVPGSDLYSLGCVAYELFHGQPPFVSDSHFELITRHDRDPIPMRRGNLTEAAVSAWLERLLAKYPHERFADLAAVLLGLDGVEDAFRPRPEVSLHRAPPPAGAPTPTIAPEATGPQTSVHLLREQSLMEFEGRQSIVPLTGADGGPIPADGTLDPSPPARVDLPPFNAAGYEILGEVGRGGMGVVYKARQRSLNRIVALKMILSGQFTGTDQRNRFRTEAEAIARLQHPNILQIYDFGEHEGMPYFALEFCDGGNLSSRLREQSERMDARESARLVETLARAAHHAHQHGIIHRDIKPANVLLDRMGTPKLTDFGLAKKLDEEGQTHSGVVMGTPRYMAPEQAQGRSSDVGAAADIYSLGAVLYECLTGRPPFEGQNVMETLMKVMQGEVVPPSRLASDIPTALDAICMRCLDVEPTSRYPTAEALADDLHRFLEGEPVTAPAARRRSKSTPPPAKAKRKWWPFG